MTYREIQSRLAEAGIEDADFEARVLVSHFCGVSPARLMCDPGADYDAPALLAAVERRAERYPLQYLTGVWDFCREQYEVDENTLIPRPDTELLVELAIRLLPPGALFADLCTGSGCVAVSTLCGRPDTRAVAADLFDGTLAVAARNGVRNGVSERLTLCQADVLRPLAWEPGQFDGILSNPPYIRSEVVPELRQKTSPELAYEPAAALDGGEDGLDFYRAMVRFDRGLLKPDGFFLFEIGYDQRRDMERLAAQEGFFCRIYQDLGGRDRVALFTRRAELS